jgi:hypothetical protein
MTANPNYMEQYEKEELLAQKAELALILCAKYSVTEDKLKELAREKEDKDLYAWLALSYMK